MPLWNGTVTTGLNFRDEKSAALAVAHLQALTAVIPFSSPVLEAIEVGNECDLYYENGIRKPSYSAQDYLKDFALYQGALASAAGLPAGRVQGATFASTKWDSSILDQYMDTYSAAKGNGALRSVSLHEYPLTHCHGKVNSIYDLLTDNAVYHNVQAIAPYLAHAQTLGLPLYIGEGNSCSCGGQSGISDTFAATLWVVDSLFAHAAAGVTRWNFHGCPGGCSFISPGLGACAARRTTARAACGSSRSA